MKVCSKCNKSKDESEFYKKKVKCGLTARCKVCVGEDCRAYIKANPHKEKQYYKTYSLSPKGIRRSKVRYQTEKKSIRDRLDSYYWTIPSQYNLYKKSAKKRGFEFSITQEDCKQFHNTQCSYCGDSYKGLGIDRVNNSLGYIIKNCIACCYTCNLMKRIMGFEQFKAHITKIYKHLKL